MATADRLDMSDVLIDNLVWRLRRREIFGAQETAIETARVINQVAQRARFTCAYDLCEVIRVVGRKLVEAQPKEYTVGNTVRKILQHIREECLPQPLPQSGYSISNFVLTGHHRRELNRTYPEKCADEFTTIESLEEQALKRTAAEAVQLVMDELETVYDSVAKGAKDHFHTDEIILTLGKSRTVLAYLKAAAHTRKFSVLVAETSPTYSGHEMARALASAGISTCLVSDSSICAIISRVNKVILGAHAILANGGMFAVVGSLVVATAARAQSTPVVVCAGQFKMTPLWNAYHEYSALDFADPSYVLGFNEGELVDKVEVINPCYDFVQPELIDVYITNDGDHPPSSVYRLIKETYSNEDTEL